MHIYKNSNITQKYHFLLKILKFLKKRKNILKFSILLLINF